MRNKRRRWAMWVSAALVVLLCAVTVFAGEGETEYVPKMYATDHQGGIQFPVYRYFSGCCILLQLFL